MDAVLGCLWCTAPCLGCTESLTQCLSCLDGHHFVESFDGEGNPDGECHECPLGCATCDNETICNTCSDGYYIDADNVTCNRCAYPCETCINETYCLSCGYEPLKRIHPPTCSCLEILSETYDASLGCIVC